MAHQFEVFPSFAEEKRTQVTLTSTEISRTNSASSGVSSVSRKRKLKAPNGDIVNLNDTVLIKDYRRSLLFAFYTSVESIPVRPCFSANVERIGWRSAMHNQDYEKGLEPSWRK